MVKDFIENVLVVLIIISACAGVFAPIFFKDGGFIWGTINRKAIIIMFICFEIMIWAMVAAISIDDPSKTFSAAICLGGFSIPLGLYFAIMYARLPYARKKFLWVMRERQKYLRMRQDQHENSNDDKDINDANSRKV